jgi:hypothetical protein
MARDVLDMVVGRCATALLALQRCACADHSTQRQIVAAASGKAVVIHRFSRCNLDAIALHHQV